MESFELLFLVTSILIHLVKPVYTSFFVIEAVIPGFNGSYEVNNCGDSCSVLPNRVCKGQKCVCDADYTGDNCQDFICADRCVFHKVNKNELNLMKLNVTENL